MGLFNLFKKPVIVQDDFFGPLRFVDLKDPLRNYFEGKGFFAPTGSQTQYLIRAGVEGPGASQKYFYREFQANFAQYVEKIKPMIEDEFRNWKEDFTISDFYKEFDLVCLTIPAPGIKPLAWDMAFTTIHDLNHHITIDFVDDRPNGILIDG